MPQPEAGAAGMKRRVVEDSDDDDDAPQAAPAEQGAEAEEGAQQPAENDSDKEDLFVILYAYLILRVTCVDSAFRDQSR